RCPAFVPPDLAAAPASLSGRRSRIARPAFRTALAAATGAKQAFDVSAAPRRASLNMKGTFALLRRVADGMEYAIRRDDIAAGGRLANPPRAAHGAGGRRLRRP